MFSSDDTLPLTTFVDLVGTHLGDMAAQSLLKTASSEHGDEGCSELSLGVVEAGKLLSTALVPLIRTDSAPDIRLTAARIVVGGQSVELQPTDALRHPLLRDWIASSWSQYVSAQLIAGALLTYACPNAPHDYLEVSDDGGNIGAQIGMTFPGGGTFATITYGHAPSLSSLVCKACVGAAQLRAIGADFRAVAQGPSLSDILGKAMQVRAEAAAEAALAIKH